MNVFEDVEYDALDPDELETGGWLSRVAKGIFTGGASEIARASKKSAEKIKKGRKKGKKGKFGRIMKGIVTGGGSEIARAAKSKKGRRVLGAIATGGLSETASRKGKNKKVGRVLGAALTGGLSEAAIGRKKAKERQRRKVSTTTGEAVALTARGSRKLRELLDAGPDALVNSKYGRKLLEATLSNQGISAFKTKERRLAFLKDGVTALPPRYIKALRTAGGDLLMEQLSSSKKRRVFLKAARSLARKKQNERLAKEGDIKRDKRKKLSKILKSPVRRKRSRRGKIRRSRYVEESARRRSQTLDSDLDPGSDRETLISDEDPRLKRLSVAKGNIAEWLPSFLSMSESMQNLINNGFLRVLKGHWGLELGDPYKSAGYRLLIDETARRLNRLPIYEKDEVGNPSWHSSQVKRIIPKVIEEAIKIEDDDEGVSDIRRPPVLSTSPKLRPMVPVDPPSGGEDSMSVLLPILKLVGEGIEEALLPAVPPPQVELPLPEVPEMVILPRPKVPMPIFSLYEGWRRDCLSMLREIDAHVPYSRALTFPSPFFANVLTESAIKDGVYPNDASKTVSHPDGYYAPWSREVNSTGLFQIREPTAYYLWKNRGIIGYENASRMAKLPTNPQNNKKLVVDALREYPSQLYYGGVLYTLAMRWMNSAFTFEQNRITEVADSRDADLMSYVNRLVSPALPAWSILFRLYWHSSSKAGPRTSVKKGTATRVVESRFKGFAEREYARFVTLTRSPT